MGDVEGRKVSRNRCQGVILWRHVDVRMQEGRDVATPECQDVRCVALLPGLGILSRSARKGANSDAAAADAAAAAVVEREEQHRENVGVNGAIVFCDKERKHSGVIDRSAK